LTVTYSGFIGESKLLESLYKRGIVAPEIAPDLHATDDGLLMFWSTTPVAPWQTPRWIEQQRATMRPVAFARMILNQWVASESVFVEMPWWDACVDHGMRPVLSDQSMHIWVGVDASTKRDSTAIVAVTADNSAARLVWHRTFQPSPENPLDFEESIEKTILDLQRRFAVVAVLYDPYQMQSSAQRLTKAGVPMHEFPQTMGNITAASNNLFEIIKHRNLVVYPDDDMRLAVSRAVASEGARGWKITKATASHKIDVVVALGMACHGALHVACNGAAGWNEFMRRQCIAAGVGDINLIGTDVDGVRPPVEHGWKFHEPSDWVSLKVPEPIARESGIYVNGGLCSFKRSGFDTVVDVKRSDARELLKRPAFAALNETLARELLGEVMP
jgi:hypothetical protein